MTDRRVDLEDRERLTEIHHDYERFSRGVWVTLGIFFVVLLASLTATGFLIKANRTRANDVQHIFERSLRLSCQSINERHDSAIKALDAQLARIAPTLKPEQRAGLKSARDSNVALINALVAKRDCAEYVREQTGRK